MTANEFATICSEHTIAPEIAIEDEGVRDILWEIRDNRFCFSKDRGTIEKLSDYLSENF